MALTHFRPDARYYDGVLTARRYSSYFTTYHLTLHIEIFYIFDTFTLYVFRNIFRNTFTYFYILHGQVDRTLTFNIGEAKIKQSKEEKLLGVWVSNDLKWSHHIEKLESNLRSRLYSLRKMEQFIPKSQLKDVADSIFVSILRYALGLYCPIRIKPDDPVPSSINAIRVTYNDVLRLLCNSKRDERKPIGELLGQLGWLSLNQMSCEVRLIEVWKSLNLEDYCLKDLFERVNSRNSERIRLKSAFKSRLRENSFHYPSVRIWNTAPSTVTHAKTESQARKAIRNFVQTLPI